MRSSSWPHRQPAGHTQQWGSLSIMHMYNFEQVKAAFLESGGVVQISQPRVFHAAGAAVEMDPKSFSWPLPVSSKPPVLCLLLFLAFRPLAGADSVFSSASCLSWRRLSWPWLPPPPPLRKSHLSPEVPWILRSSGLKPWKGLHRSVLWFNSATHSLIHHILWSASSISPDASIHLRCKKNFTKLFITYRHSNCDIQVFQPFFKH